MARALFSNWVPFELAVVLSHIVGMVTAYTLTRVFVFERSGRSARSELSWFAAVNVVSAGVTWLISVTLVRVAFPALHFEYHPELVAHVCGLAVAAIGSFVGHSRYSFRKAQRQDV
jgi:putative flippase GtrA